MMPNLEVYQLIGPVISLYFIIRLSRQYFRNEKRMVTVLIWMAFWVGVAILAIIPNPVTNKLAETLGFKSNVTAIIFVSLAVLFLLVFYQSSQITKLEAQLTNLVRQIAKEEIRDRTDILAKNTEIPPVIVKPPVKEEIHIVPTENSTKKTEPSPEIIKPPVKNGQKSYTKKTTSNRKRKKNQKR